MVKRLLLLTTVFFGCAPGAEGSGELEVEPEPQRIGNVDVVVKTIQGVDVLFQAEPGDGHEEGFSLVPRIEQGCLFGGEYLVIWPFEGEEQAQVALTLASKESGEEIELGGNDMSKEEIGDSPTFLDCTFEKILWVTD